MFPNITYWPWIETKPAAATFFTNLTYANLWPFATGGHETVYFVKTNLEYPDFLFHILLI